MLLGLVMVRIMPETNFSPAIEERQGLLKDFVCLFKLNLGFVKGAPVLLTLLAITLCGDLPVKALTGSPPLIFWMTR